VVAKPWRPSGTRAISAARREKVERRKKRSLLLDEAMNGDVANAEKIVHR
jgi:hypothetical protein